MESQTLTPDYCERLIDRERKYFDELVNVARALEATGAQVSAAEDLRRHVDEPFLIVIVGEVKSGKSTLINELLGCEVCAEGPTPLTDRIHVLKHGPEDRQRVPEEFVVERELPVDLLRDLCVVDTPGTNSILRRHSEITERFLPRADLVLFLTSIDRPYSESEDRFLAQISDVWRKKVVFLVTKIDGRPDQDVREVVDYVRQMCLRHHGFEPKVLPVSALQHRSGADGGMSAVRELIRSTLAGGQKIVLKIDSPLRSSQTILDELERLLKGRSLLLEGDFRSVQDLDRQVGQSGTDLKERVQKYVPRILDLFQSCEERAGEFLEENLTWGRLGWLGKNEALKGVFEEHVSGDLRERFSQLVHESSDWLMREEIALFEQATRYLSEKIKPNPHAERLLAEDAGRFEYRREQVFSGIEDTYQRELAVLNVPAQARNIVDDAHRGITRQIGVSALALLIGAGSLGLFASTFAHVIGLVAAVALSASGFAILPAVRRRARSHFAERLRRVADEVRRSFEASFQKEIDAAIERMRRAWEPFLRFHRSESRQIEDLSNRLQLLRRGAAALGEELKGMESIAVSNGRPEREEGGEKPGNP